jgi:hypothetical protein
MSISCRAQLHTPFYLFFEKACCAPSCFWVLWPALFFGIFFVRSTETPRKLKTTSVRSVLSNMSTATYGQALAALEQVMNPGLGLVQVAICPTDW